MFTTRACVKAAAITRRVSRELGGVTGVSAVSAILPRLSTSKSAGLLHLTSTQPRSFASEAAGESSSSSGRGRWILLGSAGLLLVGTSIIGDGPLGWIRGTATFRALTDRVGVPLIRMIFDAENAHIWTIRSLALGLGPKESIEFEMSAEIQAKLSTSVFGLSFRNPLGLSAGFDKQAQVMGQLLELGFGFVEVGGVTPEPQPGNPQPRCFRLLEDNAVINRYGLNSEGHKAIVPRLEEYNYSKSACDTSSNPGRTPGAVPTRYSGPIGVNLAKNTTSTDAEGDYRAGVKALGPHVQFLVVNVSCPNVAWTKNLKGSDIAKLIEAVREERDKLLKSCETGRSLPVLLKIGPDSDDTELKGLVRLAQETRVDGLVVSNTSSKRPETLQSPLKVETGGLSGAPLKEQSLETLRKVYRISEGKLPLVGVGGIFSGKDAYDRIRAGASLLQIYTAMVYEGPGVVHRMKQELADLLERDGFRNVQEAVGVDHQMVSA